MCIPCSNSLPQHQRCAVPAAMRCLTIRGVTSLQRFTASPSEVCRRCSNALPHHQRCAFPAAIRCLTIRGVTSLQQCAASPSEVCGPCSNVPPHHQSSDNSSYEPVCAEVTGAEIRCLADVESSYYGALHSYEANPGGRSSAVTCLETKINN